MTTDQLNQLINIVASITLFEMMAAIGLGVTVADVLRVATDWRLVAKASLASYVLVPAAAVGLLILFQADPYVATGFLICAVCPGAPYGPPFTGMAKGNMYLISGLACAHSLRLPLGQEPRRLGLRPQRVGCFPLLLRSGCFGGRYPGIVPSAAPPHPSPDASPS